MSRPSLPMVSHELKSPVTSIRGRRNWYATPR
jgi:hypothetical protein